MPSFVSEMMFKEVVREFDENPYAFFSTFEKLKVSELSEFRRLTGKVAKRSMVVKHSFAKKIFSERQWQGAEKLLKGSIVVTFGTREPQMISKTILDYIKTNDKLASAGVVFENRVYDGAFVQRLAKLPSREELLTQVVIRIKSPITGLVLTLGQMVRGLVTVLNEVKKKKETQQTA
jgi:large subunit ribosomal protein L10